jgi:hypothetical protein
MRDVDSQALRLVSRALGIGNPVTAVEQVSFDDSVLQQVLEVGPLVRRGGTLERTAGLYMADFDNVHAAPGAVASSVDPYAPSSPGAGYPSPVPTGLEVWLLGAQVAAVAGVHSTTQHSRVSLLVPGVQRAFGDAAPTNYTLEYSLHLGELPILAGTVVYINALGYTGTARRAVRVTRGSTINMSSVAANAGTITFQLGIGLFPVALGEDAFGAS